MPLPPEMPLHPRHPKSSSHTLWGSVFGPPKSRASGDDGRGSNTDPHRSSRVTSDSIVVVKSQIYLPTRYFSPQIVPFPCSQRILGSGSGSLEPCPFRSLVAAWNIWHFCSNRSIGFGVLSGGVFRSHTWRFHEEMATNQTKWHKIMWIMGIKWLLVVWLFGCLCCLVVWLFGCLSCLFVCLFVCWLVGWLGGWLGGWVGGWWWWWWWWCGGGSQHSVVVDMISNKFWHISCELGQIKTLKKWFVIVWLW